MTDAHNKLWQEFRAEWPAERVRRMTLDEYTNLNVKDAFIYALEFTTLELGSVGGGSAYKFGVYARRNTDKPAVENERGRALDGAYGWSTKYGATLAAAFKTVRDRIVSIIDAIEAGNLEAIDDIDFSPTVKWKIAFLYQDPEHPLLFSVFSYAMLLEAYKRVNPTARKAPPSLMYATLMDHHRLLDVFSLGEKVASEYKLSLTKPAARAWAVPLSGLDRHAAEQLCAPSEVTGAEVPEVLSEQLEETGIMAGDELALLIGDRVHALARVTEAVGGDFAWSQTHVDIPSRLAPVPVTPVLLDDVARAAIWDQARPPGKVRRWRIQPDTNARAWPEWRAGEFIAIGWGKLGDLSTINEDAFDARREKIAIEDAAYTAQGAGQVWRFRNIKVGDRVVVNQGWSKVLAIGTVTGGYRFVSSSELPHQLPVHWDSLAERDIKKQGWSNTLSEVNSADFLAIEGAVSSTIAEQFTTPALTPAPCRPQNLILYGPPGTGKTYATIDRALELILGKSVVAGMSRDTRVKQFRELQQRGQVEFVTFHQAYGYEEFVEGLRPQLGQDTTEVRYEMHAGAFKSMALRAAAEGLRSTVLETPSFDILWERLLAYLGSDENRVFEGTGGKSYLARVTSRGGVEIRPVEVDDDGNITERDASHQVASKTAVKLVWDSRDALGPEPEKITSKKTGALFAEASGGAGGHHYTAIWIAYRELFQLAKAATGRQPSSEELLTRVQQILDKKTAGLVDFSFSAASPQYVLVIDEINRGNIAKIMGELITLLEPDKRLGEKGELKLPLAYTPEHRFAVPPNLHVVGTMNTADRSIAVIDIALRRRFRFEELLPDLNVLEQDLKARLADVAFCDLVVDVVRTLNDRIRFLYDRDHQLGHAFFMGIASYADLQDVFLERVIPMLQEYFYGAWDKICAVLGCPYADDGRPRRKDGSIASGAYRAPLIDATVSVEVATLGFDHDDHDDRLDFTVSRRFATRSTSSEELIPFFVGVLGGSTEERTARTAALLAGALATTSAAG